MREWISPDGRVRLVNADCLEFLPTLEAGSVDAVIADLPYGTTACKWDQVIPFEPLWAGYKHAAKKNAAIVLTASQPFTTTLISSNLRGFRYCWYWRKNRGTNFQHAKRQPLRIVEEVCVFGGGAYYPQGLRPYGKTCKNSRSAGGGILRETNKPSGLLRTEGHEYIQEFTGYPNNILEFPTDRDKLHPTQKPVALMEYLIRTYTNEGELVLDNTMGSGTTGVACMATGRRFIGIEKDPGIYDTAVARIQAELAKTTLFQESA